MAKLVSEIPEQVADRHVIGIPRLSHDQYLRLLALSDVFLSPFPFGAGITSSDAISVCLPLVVFPEAVSVLQITLAQILRIHESLSQQMIARSLNDYGESTSCILMHAC